MKHIRLFIIASILTLATSTGLAFITPAQLAFAATTPEQVACEAINGSKDCSQGGDLTNLIKTIVHVMSVIVGVIAMVMIVFAGFKYITSGGESNKIANAKNTLIYALVGLIIVALAQFMVRVVLKEAKNVSFAVPSISKVMAKLAP